MQISLAEKRVFVTAGGDGIGRSIVLALAEVGATVFTCDIEPAGLGTLPDSVTSWTCDVSNSAALDAVFDEVLPGGLDIMVNNAGISGPTKPVEDITDNEWRKTMAVCLDSQFYCTRRVAPIFKAQRSGVIINLISAAGIFGYPNRSPYATAKWGVTGFTETMAMELGPHNVRVNGVVPGNVNGDRNERVIHAQAEARGLDPEEVRRLYAVGTSMQCYVEPEEIADLIVFLCSDYGRHISGQIIAVDGNTETIHPRT